jgi:hypothetical protein
VSLTWPKGLREIGKSLCAADLGDGVGKECGGRMAEYPGEGDWGPESG